ncbi:MAG: 1-(5-phosphoribosyl)-5-[(5-phosphoribosylamino)methylideneamino]imidazole-4-carboxamide isomerase [bacterium]
MQIIPAIDLMKGECVRLSQGDAGQKTSYSISPLKVIRQFYKAGVEKVHIIDLEGAFSGRTKNKEVIKKIIETSKVTFELGGGIRSIADIEMWIDNGIDQVILGTAAVTHPELVQEAVHRFGSQRIIVGVDVRSGKVATQGWKNVSSMRAEDFAETMEKAGVSRFVYTDIKSDGMMQGPDISSLKKFVRSTKASVTAAGGIRSIQDIIELQQLEGQGVDSVVVGRAIYEGKLDVREAVRCIRKKEK